jgi:hypothetical protein
MRGRGAVRVVLFVQFETLEIFRQSLLRTFRHPDSELIATYGEPRRRVCSLDITSLRKPALFCGLNARAARTFAHDLRDSSRVAKGIPVRA